MNVYVWRNANNIEVSLQDVYDVVPRSRENDMFRLFPTSVKLYRREK